MSAVVFPDWYEDPFVNMENLCIDIFTKAIPGVESGCWTPDDWLDDPDPDPMLQFYRMPGGHVDWFRGSDEGVIQASATTTSREDSIKVLSLVRAVLLPMQGWKFKMDDGFTAQIHDTCEHVGPEMLTPGQKIDTRIQCAQFKLKVGLKSRKRYDQIVAAL